MHRVHGQHKGAGSSPRRPGKPSKMRSPDFRKQMQDSGQVGKYPSRVDHSVTGLWQAYDRRCDPQYPVDHSEVTSGGPYLSFGGKPRI